MSIVEAIHIDGTITFKSRVKALGKKKMHLIAVSRDEAVRVWSDVDKAFTISHLMDGRDIERMVKIAAMKRLAISPAVQYAVVRLLDVHHRHQKLISDWNLISSTLDAEQHAAVQRSIELAGAELEGLIIAEAARIAGVFTPAELSSQNGIKLSPKGVKEVKQLYAKLVPLAEAIHAGLNDMSERPK